MESKTGTSITIDDQGFVIDGPTGMAGASVFSNMLLPEEANESGELLRAARALPCRWKLRQDGTWI